MKKLGTFPWDRTNAIAPLGRCIYFSRAIKILDGTECLDVVFPFHYYYYFTFISIYFMLNLLPGHKLTFCFVSVFWDNPFPCVTSSSRLGVICSFSLRIILMWQGELMYGYFGEVQCRILCAVFTGMCLVTRGESAFTHLGSALLCAFLNV